MHADVVARCVQFGAQKTDIPIESKVNGCSFILTTEHFLNDLDMNLAKNSSKLQKTQKFVKACLHSCKTVPILLQNEDL